MSVVDHQIQKASCSSAVGGEEPAGRKGTISQYFTTLHCPVCDELTQLGVCAQCRADPQRVAVTLYQDVRQWESQQEQLLKVSPPLEYETGQVLIRKYLLFRKSQMVQLLVPTTTLKIILDLCLNRREIKVWGFQL